jgi:hypothetical protein
MSKMNFLNLSVMCVIQPNNLQLTHLVKHKTIELTKPMSKPKPFDYYFKNYIIKMLLSFVLNAIPVVYSYKLYSL